jgi:hypothetical protein
MRRPVGAGREIHRHRRVVAKAGSEIVTAAVLIVRKRRIARSTGIQDLAQKSGSAPTWQIPTLPEACPADGRRADAGAKKSPTASLAARHAWPMGVPLYSGWPDRFG